MGTNYYLRGNPACPHCGRCPDQGLHIGKSSSGWTFGLRVYTDDAWRVADFAAGIGQIHTLADWLPLFDRFGVLDEYGDEVEAAEMIEIITERTTRNPTGLLRRTSPLLRAAVCDGDTYDLVPVEFS